MAAAALSTTRGLVGVRVTIFIILCLLSLLYVASSLTNKELLELKERFRKAEEAVAKSKADLVYRKATASGEFDENMKQISSLLELMKTLEEDFPPLVELINSLNRFIDKTKIWLERQQDSLAAKIKDSEKDLEEMRKLIKLLEKQQDEL